MKKFAYSLIIASLTNGLVAYQAAAATMDPLTTAQSVKTTSGNPAQSTESTTNLLGDSRIAALYPPAGAKASITIGGGEAKYEYGGTEGNGARIGWGWYVNQSTKAVDLTEGGALNAFQIRVESMTEGDLLIQIDALDKDNRYDSVAQVISAKPSQPLTYDFNAFLTSTSDKHVDFTRIIGVQIEFQWRQGSTGSMALGPLETVTTSVAAK